MKDKVVTTPEYEALHAFDARYGTQPPRLIAEGIVRAARNTDDLVDLISHAIEDGRELGVLRGPLEEAAKRSSPRT